MRILQESVLKQRATSPILAVLGLYVDSYERLPMLYYSLKHVESPLGISSTQTHLFNKVCKKLKIKFTIRVVNSQAKPFDGINTHASMVRKK